MVRAMSESTRGNVAQMCGVSGAVGLWCRPRLWCSAGCRSSSYSCACHEGVESDDTGGACSNDTPPCEVVGVEPLHEAGRREPDAEEHLETIRRSGPSQSCNALEVTQAPPLGSVNAVSCTRKPAHHGRTRNLVLPILLLYELADSHWGELEFLGAVEVLQHIGISLDNRSSEPVGLHFSLHAFFSVLFFSRNAVKCESVQRSAPGGNRTACSGSPSWCRPRACTAG